MGAPSGRSDPERFVESFGRSLSGTTKDIQSVFTPGKGSSDPIGNALAKKKADEDFLKLYGKEGETMEQAQARKQLADVSNNPDTYAGFRTMFGEAAAGLKTDSKEFQDLLRFSSQVGVYDPKTGQLTGASEEAKVRMYNMELMKLMTERPGKKSLLAGR